MDVAALSLKIDSASVAQAANDLDKFSGAASRASNAAGLPSGSINRIVADIQRYATLMRGLSPANDNAASSMQRLTTAQNNLGESVRKTTGDIQAQIQALRDLAGLGGSGGGTPGAGGAGNLGAAFATLEAAALSAAAALRTIDPPPGGGGPTPRPGPSGGTSSGSPYYGAANFEATGQAARLAAHEAQNLFYQLNDVFVSLASGQRPLTVFIQQGSQIGQVYAQTGLGLKGFTLALATMLGIMNTTTAATEAAAFAQAQQATASIAAANAQATSNVRAAETNIAIARTQISMATTATEAAAAEARLAAAVAALGPAQAEAAITARALAKAQEEQAAAAAGARAATTTSLTALGVAAAAVAVVLGIATAGIAALTSQANDDSGLRKYTTAMGYTKTEVQKLNAVTVTWGDTFKAVFQVGFSRVASALGISTAGMSKAWATFLDYLATGTRAVIAGLYAAWAGLGYSAIRVIDNIKNRKVENPFATLANGYKTAYGDAQKFMDDVTKRAGANARARQADMAKGFYDAPKAKKGRDEFGYDDLLKEADKMRNDLTKAAAQIGLYGEALARVTYEQDLLNKASERGLKLSPAQRTAIAGIAAELAKMSEANRQAKFMEDFRQQTTQQLAALDQAKGAIGLTGAALAEYTAYQEALNKAVQDHITLTDADREAMRLAAAQVGAATYSNTVAQSREDNFRWHNEQMRQLEVERGALGLTGQALMSYNYQQQLINQSLADGVQFADLDIESIRRKGDAYAMIRTEIEQQARAIEDSREVTRGFFADWIEGVRQGGNLFKTFAESVVNSLNRIIDKLLDRTLDGFLDSMFRGSGGGLAGLFGQRSPMTPPINPNALGGIYGTPTRFANGGAFTNSIVTAPTLFRFANGGALGEMGEAGPEAIMPLKRGPNGALGVEMHGGRAAIRLGDVHLHQSFAGAIGPEAIAAMNRQSAEEAVTYIRREFGNIAAEYEANGGVVS